MLFCFRFFYGIAYDDDDEAIREYWDMVPEVSARKHLVAPFYKFFPHCSYHHTNVRLLEMTTFQMPNQICFSEAVTNSTIRKGILLGMVVSASQIFSGSMASISYSTRYGSAYSDLLSNLHVF